jgi:GAF domain-containing protein
MTAAEFRAAYTSAVAAYVAAGDEATRRAAYELGRDAVASGLGLMDVADAHHDALLAALGAGTPAEAATGAARDLLLETLSAFEMLRRGAGEAVADAERERRHAAVMRRLSDFLADASLAAGADGPTHEVLHLLAEQARELIGGMCCVASARRTGDRPAARAASFTEAESALASRLALADLSPLEDAAWALGPVARVDPSAQLARSVAGAEAAAADIRSWLGAPLTRLDGRPIGFIHLFERRPDAYTAPQGDVLLQLAQLGSAALERADLYAERAADSGA